MNLEKYIPKLIASGIVIVVLYFIRFVVHKVVMYYGQLLQKSTVRRKQIKQILYVLLNILFVFALAIIWGVNPENLLIGLSSIFAVIGVAMFAQWSILSNITAGIIMFFNAPFRIGNRIHIHDKDLPIDATIENIHTFYTDIRTDEGELIVIPNNLFLQKIVSVRR
ncbi:MAG: mechanosensitive ion channel family protein [Tannerellaceae bacterium]|nr:mechanosensitive ion channel family protein [Tannerellaceae bacterium]